MVDLIQLGLEQRARLAHYREYVVSVW
jgi:hypothetical protein